MILWLQLESLRKGEGLQKEEDAAIKANTYDPDNSPKNEKSNKRRQKLQEQGQAPVYYSEQFIHQNFSYLQWSQRNAQTTAFQITSGSVLIIPCCV